MGVPDFLKYVARTSPGALCRLPQVSAGSATSAYDYVLVDATNADKTVGFDALFTFLCHPHVMARRALIFAVDAQRDRSGTSRHQRQSLVMVGDLDVKVQRLCVKLIDYYQKLERESGGSSFTAPMVVMSGRHVAGEADYKMLDLHRNIMAASLATNDAALPSFLFVSEDSDVVCGALCGPAPQQVTIATNLHDTMFEMGLLRLTPVLAYVAVCVDALVRTKSESTEAPHMAPQTTRPRQPPPPQQQEAPVRIAAVEPPKEPDTNVVRRKKQDGPMVATGVRIELTDSDEDQDEEAKPTISTSAATQVSVEPSTTVTSASVSPSLGEYELAAGDLTQSSCVDLVFLFVVVMGNGANVPPLMRGVTKVDIASCWQTYCKLKYNDGTDATRQSGRRLVSLSSELSTTHRVPFRDDQASISLNCSFLQAIIDSVHYADAQTRPPVEEEQERAMTYISHALYAVVRYLVGCNMSTEAALRDSSLDMRALSEGADIAAPSLASMMWVLGQQPFIRCRFPLQGVATPEQLQHASQPGKVANEETNQATEGVAASRSQQQLQLSVGEALVAPSSSSSWAVRGAGARTIRLEQLLGKPGARPTRPAPNTRSETLSAQIKQYARAHHIGTVGQDIFSAMVGTWRRSVAMSVGELRELGSTGVFLSPATGQLVTGPLPTEGEQQNSNSSGRLVYSFELRRMTPVAEMAKPTQSNNSSSSSAEKSHLMAALGLSFDYDAVERPTPVSGEVRERDLMKEARRAAASAKRSRPEEGSDKKGEKMSRSETAGEQDKTKDGATAKKRPGKKERQRLQQQQQQQQASQPNSA